MSDLVCPCCERPWPIGRTKAEARRLLADIIVTNSHQAKILGRLVDRMGEFVPRRELVELVYADEADGGPLYAMGVIGKLMRELRIKIEPRGFSIEGRPRYGSRLFWCDSQNEAAA